jgi:hypothetical protein
MPDAIALGREAFGTLLNPADARDLGLAVS